MKAIGLGKFSLLTLCILPGILIAGCSSPGILATRLDRNALPTMGKAPVDGIYGLFIAGESLDLTGQGVSLKQGQPLGFESGEDGMIRWLYAVAGNVRYRLDVTQTYEWRRQQ
jgi:hypothetical protein